MSRREEFKLGEIGSQSYAKKEGVLVGRDWDPVSGRHDGALLVPIFSPHSGSKRIMKMKEKGPI